MERPTHGFLEQWEGIADAHGLVLHRQAVTLTGDRDGVGISVEPRWRNLTRTDEIGETRAIATVLREVSVAAKVPAFGVAGLRVRPQNLGDTVAGWFGRPDVQLGVPRLDAFLHIQARDEQGARLQLREPEVLGKLERCLTANAVYASGGEVQLIVGGPLAIREAIDAAVGTALALARAQNPVLIALSEHLGLPLDWQTLRGEIDDIQLDVTPEEGPEGADYRVMVDWPLGRRDGIFPRRSGDRAEGVGAPILDATLVFSRMEPALVRERLATEDVRPLLLELLHGRPGAGVNKGKLFTTARHDVDDLRTAVDGALALVRLLST